MRSLSTGVMCVWVVVGHLSLSRANGCVDGLVAVDEKVELMRLGETCRGTRAQAIGQSSARQAGSEGRDQWAEEFSVKKCRSLCALPGISHLR